MGEGIIVRRGGGASLNYKIISGSKPSGGGGDTLVWDGNTEGLESVSLSNGFEFFRISDAVPTRADCENGVTVVRSDGSTETLTNCFDVNDLGVFGFVISVPKDNFEWEGEIFPKAGCWAINMGGLYVSSLTIPNYTGFGGGASVKENTIWVDTNTKITSHAFSATEPTNPVEGMVWFKVGATSVAPFNALKKNSIMVYVDGCSQYISGAWVAKNAQIYQGEWKSLAITTIYLFDGTNDVTATSGEWEKWSGTGSFSIADGVLKMTVPKKVGDAHTAIFRHKTAVNMSAYNTVTVTMGTISSYANNRCYVCVYDANQTQIASAKLVKTTTVYTLDVSGVTQDCYVGFSVKSYFDGTDALDASVDAIQIKLSA